MRSNITNYLSLVFVLFFFAIANSYGQCPNNLSVELSDCGEIQASVNEFGEVGNIVWYWGDDTQSSGANYVSHQYEESGIYNVCVAAWTGECAQGIEICQEVEVEICDNTCELNVEVVQDGNVLYFTPFNYPDNATIYWSVNGEGNEPGEEFTFELNDPGTYQICAVYETPECPEGVFWCETWTVEGEGDCPGEDDFYANNVEGSCTSWVFEIGSFVEGEQVFWEYGDGTWEWGGHFTDHLYQEEGEFEVCGHYASPLCPDTVILCQTILVQCEETPCDLDIEVLQDGNVLYFTPFNYPDNATIYWSVNGEGNEPGEEFTFELNDPGTYQICAAYETPECPEGVFWCETWTVEGEGGCPGEDDFYADNIEGSCTSWIFEIGSFVEGEQVFWEYGDGTWEWGGHFTDHLYQEPGEYEVCAHYSSSLCPDTVIICETIVVECGENPCELDMEVEQDGDTLLFYPFNFPDNATIGWTLNGEWMGTGDMYSISIADPGVYQVCASYETPECPNGVFWCETWTVEEDDCPFELSVNDTEDCGCYELALNGQWGGSYIWNLGDTSFTSISNAVGYCYEPGNYTGYVQVLNSNYPDCEQTPLVFSIEVPNCEENECELDVEVVQDGDTVLLYPFNYPDGATLSWTLNGEYVGMGDLYAISVADPGVYEVCAMYETPECPEGVFWCETWTVEGEGDCPTEEDFYANNVEGSCTSWVFEIGSFVEGEQVFWEYGDGTWEWGGHFTDHLYQEEGEYEVCGHYASPLCPDTVILCQTILVQCEETPCDLDIEVLQDGNILYFTPFNYPDNAIIYWSVNGEGNEPGEEFTFELNDPGTYQICAAYETPECPEGVFWCETWTVEGEDDCPGEGDLDVVMQDCDSWIFEIGSFVEGVEVYWNFGDGDDEWAGHIADHHYDEDGVYTVWALYYSPLCEDSIYFQETIEVNCNENPCELDVQVEQDGDTVLFYPFNYPDNAIIGWTLNGEWVGTGGLYAISIAEPGVFEVCASYETPECPEGVFWCETIVIEDEGCPYDLIVEETEECGCYDFAINEAEAGSNYMWNLGDTVFTSTSHEVTYCFEPGFQTMYVQIMNSNYPECNNAPLVYQWEVPECEDPECSWFEFEVSTNADLLPIDLDWEMSEQNGVLAGSGSLTLSGDTTTFNGEVCLVPGCYVLTISSDFPIGLGDFEFDFPIIPGLPISIDWIQDDNPFTLHTQIDLAGNCEWPVGIAENPIENVAVYPVPATDLLNIRLGENIPTEIRLYDTAGKLLHQEKILQSGSVDVSRFPAGYYVLQLQQGKSFKTFSVPLLN